MLKDSDHNRNCTGDGCLLWFRRDSIHLGLHKMNGDFLSIHRWDSILATSWMPLLPEMVCDGKKTRICTLHWAHEEHWLHKEWATG